MEEILNALKLPTVSLWLAIREYCLDLGEDSQSQSGQQEDKEEDVLPVGQELPSPGLQRRQQVLSSIIKNYHLAIAFLAVIDQTLTKASADSPKSNHETQLLPSQDLTQAVRMIQEAREQLRTLTKGREEDSVIQSVMRKLQRISLPHDRIETKKDIQMVIQLLSILQESSVLFSSQAVKADSFTPPRHSPGPPSSPSIKIPVTYSSSFPPSTCSSLSVSFSPMHSFLLSARTRSASFSPTENYTMPSQGQQRGRSHSARVPLYHHKKRATHAVPRHVLEFEAKASGANRSFCASASRRNNKAVSSCHFAGEAVSLQSASLEAPLTSIGSMHVKSRSLPTYVPSYGDYVRALSSADEVASMATVSYDSYLFPDVYTSPNNESQSPQCNDREHIQVRMMISWLNAIDRLCHMEKVGDDFINRVADMKASLTSLLCLSSIRELQHSKTDLTLSIDRLKACGEDIKEISRSLEVSSELCKSLDALVHSFQLLDDIIIVY